MGKSLWVALRYALNAHFCTSGIKKIYICVPHWRFSNYKSPTGEREREGDSNFSFGLKFCFKFLYIKCIIKQW
jgi:hypothetical protein